jgi:hypothetical protein
LCSVTSLAQLFPFHGSNVLSHINSTKCMGKYVVKTETTNIKTDYLASNSCSSVIIYTFKPFSFIMRNFTLVFAEYFLLSKYFPIKTCNPNFFLDNFYCCIAKCLTLTEVVQITTKQTVSIKYKFFAQWASFD